MSIEREHEELIQVAAVAVASMENLRFGQAQAGAMIEMRSGEFVEQVLLVMDKIMEERDSQDAKWGEQLHSRLEWAMILAEEIGEWADEVRAQYKGTAFDAEMQFANDVLMSLSRAGDGARTWLELHEWPERQQQVMDEEKANGHD